MSGRKWPKGLKVTKITINGRPWWGWRRVLLALAGGDNRMMAWLAFALAVCTVIGIFIDRGCRF